MKDSTRVAVVAVLAIFAVAVTAATIESTVVPETSGPEGPDGSGGGSGGGLGAPPQSGPSPGETLQIPFLAEILALLGVLLALAMLVYLYAYWRTALKAVVAFAALVGVLALLVALLDSTSGAPTPPMMEPGNGSLSGGGGGGTSEPTDQPSLPAVLLLLVLVAGLAGTIIAYLRTSSPTDEPATDASRKREVDTAAVGDAAGRAADRLEGAANVDNEVYRAWREMTDLLDVPDPETSTPGEFATAAVEADMGSDDVNELTRLFEDVRYGDAAPSAEREQRAIDIFRRIEARYAEDES